MSEKSLHSQYIAFSISLKREAGYKCQLCGYVNPDNQDKSNRIVCHHILPVSNYGIISPLLMLRQNIIVVCNYCHWTKCHGYSMTMADIRQMKGAGGVSKWFKGIMQGPGAAVKMDLAFKKGVLARYGR